MSTQDFGHNHIIAQNLPLNGNALADVYSGLEV